MIDLFSYSFPLPSLITGVSFCFLLSAFCSLVTGH